jgi:hypothetical protein
MNRRSFLKALAAVPFAPSVLRHHAERLIAEDEEREAEALRTRPADSILGVAMGEPSALTIAVPPNRTIEIFGHAFLVPSSHRPAQLQIVEGPRNTPTVLAVTAVAGGDTVQEVEARVILRPSAGSHTYRLVATHAEMLSSWGSVPLLKVEDVT